MSSSNPKIRSKFIINGSSNTISFSIININNKQKSAEKDAIVPKDPYSNLNSETKPNLDIKSSPKTQIKVNKNIATSGIKISQPSEPKLAKFDKINLKRYQKFEPGENSSHSIDKLSSINTNATHLHSDSQDKKYVDTKVNKPKPPDSIKVARNPRDNKFTTAAYSKSVEKEHYMTMKREDLEHITKRNDKLLRSNQILEAHRYKSESNNTNRNVDVPIEEAHFPLSAKNVVQSYSKHLTSQEMSEILEYKNIYFLGHKCKKVNANPQQKFNFGQDDDKGDQILLVNDHVAYRYEILEALGKGSFGQVVKVFDHKRKEFCALKLVRNRKRFHQQAMVEVKILKHLRDNDPEENFNVVKVRDSFMFRKHVCITFELLSINLQEFIRNNNFKGLSLGLIRRFSIQILYNLKQSRANRIVHCDLKPENILLKNPTKSGIKVIDQGSSCFVEERMQTYIQSRFYRAPEVIFGLPYGFPIDMWSFGCIMAELQTGVPIFPGEDEVEQVACMMEILGMPGLDFLKDAPRAQLFYDRNWQPRQLKNSRGKLRNPGSKHLSQALNCRNENFIDFLLGCFQWNPEDRMTPEEALQHDYILEGLPEHIRNNFASQNASEHGHANAQGMSSVKKSQGKGNSGAMGMADTNKGTKASGTLLPLIDSEKK